jgi:hypothetical protein
MRGRTRVGLYGLLAFLTVAASLFILPAHSASAAPGPQASSPARLGDLPCTVSQDASLRDYPSASNSSSKEVGTVTQGEEVTARTRYRGGGADWLHVVADAGVGWLNAKRVTDCDWKQLPTEKPQRQARVPGYTPAPDQNGPDGKTVFVPDSVGKSVDGANLFRDSLMILVDPTARAFENGDTVKSVEFQIQDDQGNDVYRHIEGNAPYCVWGNSGDTCNVVWKFKDTDYHWPVEGSNAREASDIPIDPGVRYNVTINVNYDTGSNDRWQFDMRLIPRDLPAAAVYVKPSLDFQAGTLSFEDAEVRIQSDLLASAGGDPSFRGGMTFGLTPLNGVENGPGVSSVVFEVQDQDTGDTVYAHREKSAPYCFYGNSSGQSSCDHIWSFADSGDTWPDSDGEFGIPGGQPLQYDHPYYAVVTAYDGDSNFGATWSFSFTVVQ